MKKVIMSVVTVLTVAMMTTSCSSWSNTAKGTTIGSTSGAVAGALLGMLVSGKSDKGKGAVIGAAIGTAVGATTGAIIGKHMDNKAAALQQELASANVETVTDSNGLTAIKVTFDSNILFATGKSTLSTASQKSLKEFAQTMTQSDLINTDIQIKGHTDNTGTDAVNEKLSLERAQAVGNILRANNVTSSRITESGLSYSEPVADNSTAEGRAQNRRVEVFILANEAMVKQAEAGQL
jgi:outer membrane protein OmpA-like peptidoglycan-associated protein